MGTTIKAGYIHWSVTDKSTTVADLRRMHVEGNGWRDIGYHWVILHPESDELKGQEITDWWQITKKGRPINDDRVMDASEQGAHAFGFNRGTLSCVVVQKPGVALHPLQIEAVEAVMTTWCKRYSLSPSDMFGHRDVNATQCPGDELYALVKRFREGQPLTTQYTKEDVLEAAQEYCEAVLAFEPFKVVPYPKKTQQYDNKVKAWNRWSLLQKEVN